MLISSIKNLMYEKLEEHGRKALGRRLKPHERENFINKNEKKIEDIVQQSSHAFNMLINLYLEELIKDENTRI